MATPISDPYHDVALHWAVAALFAVLAWAAWRPDWLQWWYDMLTGGWSAEPTLGELLTFLMVLAVLKFTVALLILKWMPLRLALTPGATKHRRVRRRAVAVFKAAAERRTVGRTGILIYLSMAERRAEIVADEAILKVTDEHTWGEAMAALLVEVQRGPAGRRHCRRDRAGRRRARRAFPALGDRHQRNPRQADRAVNLDDLPPAEIMWEGKYVRAVRRGQWEYASRVGGIRAVVILAEHEGKVILVDQPRVAARRRCVELPAGLVGDDDPDATVEGHGDQGAGGGNRLHRRPRRAARRILFLAGDAVGRLHPGPRAWRAPHRRGRRRRA